MGSNRVDRSLHFSLKAFLTGTIASLESLLLEFKDLQAFLDMSVLMKQAPNELRGVILEHQKNQALVDSQVAFGNPRLIAFGFGNVTVCIVEAVLSDKPRNLIHMLKSGFRFRRSERQEGEGAVGGHCSILQKLVPDSDRMGTVETTVTCRWADRCGHAPRVRSKTLDSVSIVDGVLTGGQGSVTGIIKPISIQFVAQVPKINKGVGPLVKVSPL